jgi:holo-[acyl-carrier protein] synthase
MIIGTGIDIIEVQRVAEKISKPNGFREKVFSAAEIKYCDQMADSAQHYAARFAAKEAFLKATGKGLTLSYDLNEVEVVGDELGKPHLHLTGSLQEMATAAGWNKIHLSLSHVQAMACAVVIIEK